MLPDGDIPPRGRASDAASVAEGAVARLEVLLGAHPLFALTPVLSGALSLVLIAVLFHRMVPATGAYPHHWL